MKTKLVIGVLTALALTGCDVDKTRSGDLPEVDVDVSAESGRLPNYDVDWANVDIGTTTETVMVPNVVVAMEETEVEVPYMDVNLPNESENKSERNIVVEVEIKDKMQHIEIERVFATDRRLIVVSRLKDGNEPLQDQTVRVSDRIVLNAPDLDVQHIIMGKKPVGDWNNQYIFVANESALRARLNGATEIYSR
jgi:hypothetical protein